MKKIHVLLILTYYVSERELDNLNERQFDVRFIFIFIPLKNCISNNSALKKNKATFLNTLATVFEILLIPYLDFSFG